MTQTLKASIVRFNRPVLIAGTAMLGVASSKLIEESGVQSILLALAAVGLMYVGDSGRTAEDKVSAHLPADAKPSVVRTTRSHNLNGRLVVPITGFAGICLIAALVVPLVGATDGRTSGGSEFGISAPRVYRPAIEPLEIVLACPDRCELRVSRAKSAGQFKALETVFVGSGSTKIDLERVTGDLPIRSGSDLILIMLRHAQRAPLIVKIRLVR